MDMGRWGKVLLFFVAGIAAVVVFRTFLMKLPEPVSNTMVVRSYEVPADIAREVADVLSVALGAPRQNEPITPMIGRAVVAPGGQLIVTATPDVQKGVAQVIGNITANRLPPTPSIRFDLWIVTGAPGEGSARGTAVPDELAPALDSLRKSRGAMRFQLIDHLSTSARSGQDEGRVTGSRTTFRVSDIGLQKSADGSQRVVAQIRAGFSGPPGSQSPPAELRSLAELTPGELLVIGQSLAGLLREDAAPGQEIYYIVRATL